MSISQPHESMVPARLDRLPWSRFHVLLVVGLGVTWILDGLEVTLMGAVSGVLQRHDVLGLTASEIGAIGSCYLSGAVIGALIFGHFTDRFGRRKFFFLSLIVYLIGVALTALAWDLDSLGVSRLITGFGIGGEYAAVNSAIDELIPARYRGRVDLIVNGSFWLGAAVGSASTLLILDPNIFRVDLGWRLGFAVGGVLGLVILVLREFIPESPRWLLTHGRIEEAETTTQEIEQRVSEETGVALPIPDRSLALRIVPGHGLGLLVVLEQLLLRYSSRTVLGLVLMSAQAFTYNAVFFTYALMLRRYYDLPAAVTGVYLLPFALSNFLGPLLLGQLFDTIGRRTMIAATYLISALLLFSTGWLFRDALLSAAWLTILWTVMFFFASPAASSAYLTVSEIFPVEIRALAIAIFYSAGTAIGGIVAPWYFGRLIDTGSRVALARGYAVAAGLMVVAAITELVFGLAAEGASLEQIAPPLSSAK